MFCSVATGRTSVDVRALATVGATGELLAVGAESVFAVVAVTATVLALVAVPTLELGGAVLGAVTVGPGLVVRGA